MGKGAGPFKSSVGRPEEIKKDASLLSSCFPACWLLAHDFALALLFHWEEQAGTEPLVLTQDSEKHWKGSTPPALMSFREEVMSTGPEG